MLTFPYLCDICLSWRHLVERRTKIILNKAAAASDETSVKVVFFVFLLFRGSGTVGASYDSPPLYTILCMV